MSHEARLAVRAAVVLNLLHPEAETLYPPVGESKMDNLIPAALRVHNTARPSADPPSPFASGSLTPVPGPACGDSWFDEDWAPSVTLSQVEDTLETSRMIEDLHACTPPPSLLPSSSTMAPDK